MQRISNRYSKNTKACYIVATKMIFLNLWSMLEWYLRPFIKWFFRKTTRLCELQRICYGDKSGAARTCNIEKSLMLSRTQNVKEVVSYLDSTVLEKTFVPANFRDILDPSISIILRVKKINPKLHTSFVTSFRRCLEQIWSYRSLLDDVEDLRTLQFDSNNELHEEKLLKLWSLLVPDTPLDSRVTKQWQHIGFQVSYLLNLHTIYNSHTLQLMIVFTFFFRVMIPKLIFEEWEC